MTLGHQYTKKAASRDFFTNITLALKITASKRTLVSMGYYTVEKSQILPAHPNFKHRAKTQLPLATLSEVFSCFLLAGHRCDEVSLVNNRRCVLARYQLSFCYIYLIPTYCI